MIQKLTFIERNGYQLTYWIFWGVCVPAFRYSSGIALSLRAPILSADSRMPDGGGGGCIRNTLEFQRGRVICSVVLTVWWIGEDCVQLN